MPQCEGERGERSRFDHWKKEKEVAICLTGYHSCRTRYRASSFNHCAVVTESLFLFCSSSSFASRLGVGADLEAGRFAGSVVELFSQVDVVDGGRWLGDSGLVDHRDAAVAVAGAQIGIGAATVGGLTSDVELTVGGSHVGVWDGADTIVDHVRDLVLVVVQPWFLASEVDVLFAGGWVGTDGAGLTGHLDAGFLAGEEPRVEDHPADSDWIVRGVNLGSGSVADFRHDV